MNEFKKFWDDDNRFKEVFFPRFIEDKYRTPAPD
jgi:hypothetical protein